MQFPPTHAGGAVRRQRPPEPPQRRAPERPNPRRYAPRFLWYAPSTHSADGQPWGSYDAADDERGSWVRLQGEAPFVAGISPWRPETPRAVVCSGGGHASTFSRPERTYRAAPQLQSPRRDEPRRWPRPTTPPHAGGAAPLRAHCGAAVGAVSGRADRSEANCAGGSQIRSTIWNLVQTQYRSPASPQVRGRFPEMEPASCHVRATSVAARRLGPRGTSGAGDDASLSTGKACPGKRGGTRDGFREFRLRVRTSSTIMRSR